MHEVEIVRPDAEADAPRRTLIVDNPRPATAAQVAGLLALAGAPGGGALPRAPRASASSEDRAIARAARDGNVDAVVHRLAGAFPHQSTREMARRRRQAQALELKAAGKSCRAEGHVPGSIPSMRGTCVRCGADLTPAEVGEP